MTLEEKVERYDNIVAKCPRFERKGKTVPYTSANGYMFSMFNKEGEFGIRFSKETQETIIKTLDTTHYMSHGAVMRGYVLIPEDILKDEMSMVNYLNQSYDYVMTLKPK